MFSRASRLEKLWRKVQSNPGHATTEFWEYVLRVVAFNDSKWSVPSRQPPTDDDGDLRRVDLLVRDLDDDDTILLSMAAKMAQATRSQMDNVEYQAFTACCAHLHNNDKAAVWAMTCVGSKARIWAYKKGHFFVTPFWPPGNKLTGIDEYAEYSSHSEEFLTAFEYIKEVPVPDETIFESPQSPRPANATLPDTWHDREVPSVAGSSPNKE